MTANPGLESGNNDGPPTNGKSTKSPAPLLAAAGAMFVLAPVTLLVGVMIDSLPLIFVSIAASVLFVPTIALALILIVKRSSR